MENQVLGEAMEEALTNEETEQLEQVKSEPAPMKAFVEEHKPDVQSEIEKMGRQGVRTP